MCLPIEAEWNELYYHIVFIVMVCHGTNGWQIQANILPATECSWSHILASYLLFVFGFQFLLVRLEFCARSALCLFALAAALPLDCVRLDECINRDVYFRVFDYFFPFIRGCWASERGRPKRESLRVQSILIIWKWVEHATTWISVENVEFLHFWSEMWLKQTFFNV